MDKLQEIQENLFDFFKDVDDKLLIQFIDSFCYHVPIKDKKNKASKLIEKFLKENELEEAYINYLQTLADEKDDTKYFTNRLASNGLIDDIKKCLLSVAFNRFRQSHNL